MLKTIGLQTKTKVKPGKIRKYWFENSNIGLARTLFHEIEIPLEPFDSGLDYVTQPESTSISLDWFELNLHNPNQIDGLDLNHVNYPDAEGSVYVGAAP